MPSNTDSARMQEAVARLAAASASLAELLLGASGADTAPAPATSGRPSIASGPLMAAPDALWASEGASKNRAPEGPSKEIIFSCPSQRPRVLGLDEGEARLLLTNVLSVLGHARGRIHSSRRAQLDALAHQIRTALDGRKRGQPRTPPDSGAVAVAA